jgi:hypothetical protein
VVRQLFKTVPFNPPSRTPKPHDHSPTESLAHNPLGCNPLLRPIVLQRNRAKAISSPLWATAFTHLKSQVRIPSPACWGRWLHT